MLAEDFSGGVVDDDGAAVTGGLRTRVLIAALREGLPLRADGVNADHVAMLAEVPETLPPIVVHRRTMQVVDGAHRLRAAQLRGRSRSTPSSWTATTSTCSCWPSG